MSSRAERPCRKRWRTCSSSSGVELAGETFDGTRAPTCPESVWTWDPVHRVQRFLRCEGSALDTPRVCAAVARARRVDLSRCRGGQLALWPACVPAARGTRAIEAWERPRARPAYLVTCAPRALGLFPPQWCAGARGARPSVVRVTLEGLELEAATG